MVYKRRYLPSLGALVTLFDAPMRVNRGYYLKVNRSALEKPHMQDFIQCLLAAAAEVEQGFPWVASPAP